MNENERITELIAVLKSQGIKQKILAERIGVTEAAISAWRSGRRNITDQSIKAICREFNVNEEWIRTGEGEMFLFNKEDEYAKAVALLSNDPFIRNLVIEYNNLSDDSRMLIREFINRISNKGKGQD
jgi:transcriptional regulator with XRE-family HTH domain